MLRLKQYGEAVQNCYEALVIDPNNVKALYRRAQAHRMCHDFDKVRVGERMGSCAVQQRAHDQR